VEKRTGMERTDADHKLPTSTTGLADDVDIERDVKQQGIAGAGVSVVDGIVVQEIYEVWIAVVAVWNHIDDFFFSCRDAKIIVAVLSRDDIVGVGDFDGGQLHVQDGDLERNVQGAIRGRCLEVIVTESCVDVEDFANDSSFSRVQQTALEFLGERHVVGSLRLDNDVVIRSQQFYLGILQLGKEE
jgi:hypothetical protein